MSRGRLRHIVQMETYDGEAHDDDVYMSVAFFKFFRRVADEDGAGVRPGRLQRIHPPKRCFDRTTNCECPL